MNIAIINTSLKLLNIYIDLSKKLNTCLHTKATTGPTINQDTTLHSTYYTNQNYWETFTRISKSQRHAQKKQDMQS